jgi:Zn-dependent protease
VDFDPAIILLSYVTLLFSLCVHEASHAAMANYCGDPSARLLGRLSMNPLKHIDPVGTVILPLFGMMSSIPFLFGWAKPVPFNPRNLKNMRRDPVLIAIAGPASNIVMALLFLVLLRVAVLFTGVSTEGGLWSVPLCMVPMQFVMINLVLCLFNCFPVPPLDGHYVLKYFLPQSGQDMMDRIGPFGIIIAIFVGVPLIGPPLNFLYELTLRFALLGPMGPVHYLFG